MSISSRKRPLIRHGIAALCLGAIVGCSGGSDSTSTADNGAPTIGGTAPSAIGVGESYSFTPTASDPNGDPLTFSVTNLPSWATFNSGNGAISGTPLPGDEGNFSSIGITVSDGSLSASLSAFSIDVTGLPPGAVVITWDAPARSADGSTLNDLRGFRIHWGAQSGNYVNQLDVNNASATSHVVRNLTPATYFFAVTAIDTSGNESSFSNETTIVVN